ncbi:DUF6904 family protein [Flavihumibacter sp. UBA7668]|uniref:DUF6904 family protein n=1 Tax=Flavihumibacter sp. UBA7668 TaxID=1946542 RepID=UPI0025C17409|nr:hypothetical protein [Flavihumibacter sp. UBA7668]
MFQANPTPKGTGASIYGSYEDLCFLHEFIHNLIDGLKESVPEQEAQSKLLLNFAYELRKAYEGQRIFKSEESPNNRSENILYGFQIVWTDLIIYLITIRELTAYSITDKGQQGILYLLEFAVEKALDKYDPIGGMEIKALLLRRIPTFTPYAFIQYQALHREFTFGKGGKTRFRKIPKLINAYFNEWDPAHKSFIEELKASAKKINCEITQLTTKSFPKIEW